MYRKAEEALALDDEDKRTKPSSLESINVSFGDRAMLVQAGSGDDIVYLHNSAVSHEIEEGLKKRNLTKYQVALVLGVEFVYYTYFRG